MEHLLKEREINKIIDTVEKSLRDYQAVIWYLRGMIGTDVLPEEAEHHMVSEYAQERLEDALASISKFRIDAVVEDVRETAKNHGWAVDEDTAPTGVDEAAESLKIVLSDKDRQKAIQILIES